MLIIFAGLAISQAEINPLGDCALIRQVTFYDNMSSLPPEIKADIAKRHGPILPRMARGISFSDVASSSSKPGPLPLYVAHETNQWLVSYTYGGISIRTVTVSYVQNESGTDKTPHLKGALEGDGCTVANAFLKGVSVEPGWQR